MAPGRPRARRAGGHPPHQGGAVVVGGLPLAGGDQGPGQILGALPVEGGEGGAQPLVVPAVGHAVAHQHHHVSGLQLQAAHVGGRPLPGGEARGEGTARHPAHRAATADIGGRRPELVEGALAGEEVQPQQVHGGEAALLLVAEGQGGVEGLEGGLRVHARFQKTLQQADGQLALPAGRHAAAHAVAQENVEHAAVGLEERARVPAHGLAVLLPGGHAHDGLEGFGLGKDQPLQLAGLPLLRLPQGQAQQVGEGGALPVRPQGREVRALDLGPEMAGLVVVDPGFGLQGQGGEVLAQPLLPRRVGGELGGELRRSGAQQGGELPVLAAHRRAVLLQAALILPPAQDGGELLVGGR